MVEGATGEVAMSGQDAMRRAYGNLFAQAQVNGTLNGTVNAQLRMDAGKPNVQAQVALGPVFVLRAGVGLAGEEREELEL